MSNVLVVDDSAVDRLWAGSILEDELEANVSYAANGEAALQSLTKVMPDLVLTDLQMSPVNGLELVEHICSHHPQVPVMLMTAHGSEEIAIEALKKGAASYVPKRKLAEELKDMVKGVLDLVQAKREEQRALNLLTFTELRFELTNDLACIPPVIAFLENRLESQAWAERTKLIRLAVALREALINAIEHGNLEASSSLRQGDGRAYYDFLETRRSREPYRSRRVHLTARESPREVVYLIRDEGPGFDPSILPDPTDPANLELASGRGLLLIRTFMDEVYHEDEGRSITMILRKQDSRERP